MKCFPGTVRRKSSGHNWSYAGTRSAFNGPHVRDEPRMQLLHPDLMWNQWNQWNHVNTCELIMRAHMDPFVDPFGGAVRRTPPGLGSVVDA